ncbi:MAG: hypothetical protein SGI71_02890 [Verrucomicrobiota bacterium]|nr:hypothetical protein [Verrucomicrobiota bacterium]
MKLPFINTTASWTTRKTCRLCDSTSLYPFLTLGELPLAGGFMRACEIADEQRYPLTVCFCEACTEVQLLESVNPQNPALRVASTLLRKGSSP